MTLADFGRAPDIVDELVVVEGKVAGHIAVPLGATDTAAQVEFVIFPDSHDGRHHLYASGKLLNALEQAPSFWWVSAELFVEPVPIHDMEVDLVGPTLVEVFVGGFPVADSVKGILVRAGADLEAEVEEALRVVLGIDAALDRGKGEKRTGKTVGISENEDLIMVTGVGLEIDEFGDAGIVVCDRGRGHGTCLREGISSCAILYHEIAGVRGPSPD